MTEFWLLGENCFFFFLNSVPPSGGHGPRLLHIQDVQPDRPHEQGLVGKHRPHGQGESEDPRDPVQHAPAGGGKTFARADVSGGGGGGVLPLDADKVREFSLGGDGGWSEAILISNQRHKVQSEAWSA